MIIYNAILKYGIDQFVLYVLEIMPSNDKKAFKGWLAMHS